MKGFVEARTGQVFFVSIPAAVDGGPAWELDQTGGEVELLGRSWAPSVPDGPVAPFWEVGPPDRGSWDFELRAVTSGEVCLRFRCAPDGDTREHLVTVRVGAL